MAQTCGPVALVLAGGGARGACEAGVLSVLLLLLEERGERPRILIGTSVGALNVSFLAANAHLPTDELVAKLLAIWESVRWVEVARRLLSGGSLLRLGQYAAEVVNTPIKPALAFGAARVVVIALNSLAPGPRRLAGPERPDALEGARQILLGLLGDQLTADVLTLADVNVLIAASGKRTLATKRRVPYVVVAPAAPNAIGQCALRVFREHPAGPLQAIRSPDIALLARLIAGGADAQHAELLSFLLFAPQFAQALITLQQDAHRWTDQTRDVDDLWQVGLL